MRSIAQMFYEDYVELPGSKLLVPSDIAAERRKGRWASLSKKKKAAVIAAPVAAIGGGYAALRAYKKRKEREERENK